MICAFCDSDPCGCYTPEPPPVLEPAALLRLGALTLQQESSAAVERALEDQEIAYEEALRLHGPKGLITALLDRDRLLLHQGRQIADGRTVSRLAREMVRAALYSAGGRPDVQAVQKVLDQFGGSVEGDRVDARQLKLHGSTLGPLVSPEKAAEGMVSGALKERPGSATVSKGALLKDQD